MSNVNYESVLLRLPAPFYGAFYSELVAINGLDILQIDPDCESNRAIDYLTGTSGWNVALWSACKRLDCMWFYEWYESLRWYESDEFDSVLSDELVKKIEDPENRAEARYAYYLRLLNEKEDNDEELEND